MRVAVQGIGLLAPGLKGWAESRPVLAGLRPYESGPLPDPEAALLPPNERRRSSDCVRWAVQVAQEAITQSGMDARDVATVYASSGGEMSALDRLCRSLATPERVVSPTLFHQSVHNTAAGYWGIATACQQSSTALSCYDDTFAAGLLEAVTFVCVEARPVLLVAYDLAPPFPLSEARPIQDGFAAAVVLAPPTQVRLAELAVRLEDSGGRNPSTMKEEALEHLRMDNPAARSLPLLGAVASGGRASVSLNFLDDQRLFIQVG
jgi:Beta-ketoacyl synthase, N-terminal domain